CLIHTMAWPQEGAMREWLQSQGLEAAAAEAFLRASGGRPEDALALAQSGKPAQAWTRLPRALAQGDTAAFADLAPAQVIGVLQKICHDQMARASGAAPRYFAAADLPAPPALVQLAAWSRELTAAQRTAEHPFNAGLMLEALVARGRSVLNSR